MNSFVRLAPPAIFVALVACGVSKDPGPEPGAATATAASASPGEDVLATVNGVPIRAGELQYAIARKNKKEARRSDPALMKEMLEKLVNAEVVRQAAAAAGLDSDPEYRRKYRFFEAPFVQFQREELAKLYMQREIADKGRSDDAELRKYFAAHAAEIGTELHLMQILVHNDEDRIRTLKQKIDDGAAFEEMAAIRYPNALPAGAKAPWDLGVMRWTDIPTQWRQALATMKDGDVSDVIAGPSGRFWIVKLVKRQTGAAVAFDEVKPQLEELRKEEKVAGLRQKITAELRKKVEIVYTRDPATLPPPSENDE